ncbi:acetolactate decarboxylase [Microbacterium sp. AG790]|uniref:acetolactate decarboxylase n=1 Tax=Microbacterium sp. AG790 TaxID=2183995 RepID=UPI000EB42371|nr:acetolactate decarboxylase [Microbacterium sp. AG790]RKS93469.1 acetolactate decarboxylase [Microbacterium sp. AG790]
MSAERHTLFQTSLMAALLDGIYEDDMTVGELLGHGDFGIGTFNALDGEMVVVDGVAYRLRGDGTAAAASADSATPYAVVTDFVPTITRTLPDGVTRAEASAAIDAITASANYMYALRITGRFRRVTARTVTRQQKPYRPMTEATDDDAVLQFDEVDGTIVAFRTPLYEQGIGVPGCHAHFIDDGRTRGGHVLDFVLNHGTVELCLCTDLHLRLPLTTEFREAALSPDDLADQLAKTEQHAGRP